MKAEQVRKAFQYDPISGMLSRNGKEAGWLGQNGYRYVSVGNKKQLVHRVAWLHVYGSLPEMTIDHINRCKTDNRIENLREADMSLQGRNNPLRRNNTSGAKGVYWHNPSRKWMALLFDKGKSICVGYFADKDSAIRAREAAYSQRFAA